MKIKRFTARDLPTATNLIKDDFGLAAIILSQRDLPAEQGGGVEITAGVREEDLPLKGEGTLPSAPPKPRAGRAAGAAAYIKAGRGGADSEEFIPAGWSKNFESLGNSLNQGFKELKELILDLAHRQSLAEKWRDRPDLVSLYRRLLETGLAPEHSRAMLELAAESARAWGGDIFGHLKSSFSPKLRLVDLSLTPPRCMALVGPSGAGKTSTLVNLAAFYRHRGRRVAAITLDTLRLGAAEQLTQYARILVLGVQICQNQAEFAGALELFEDSELVLIDTPSRSFQKDEGRRELAAYFDKASASALLVLPATMKDADLSAALTQARSFRDPSLVLTKFDETENLGNLAGFIIAGAPRLAFFSLGPKPTEDFFMATAEKFLELWLGELTANTLQGGDSA
jgi:flagellar biosynthesis protein FlhF